jgi:hypothetical protein
MQVAWRHLWRRLGVALSLRDPPSVPPYGWSYLDHVVAVYLNLNKPDSRADEIILKSRNTPDDLTWGDIFLLESIVFGLQSQDALCRSSWIIRERFREIAGPTLYSRYESSGIPTDVSTPAKAELFRADLTRLLDVLHWCYALIPIRERIRTSLTKSCFLMVTFYTLLLILALYWCGWHGTDFLAMLTCVIYCGVIGGFVSSQRRMQSIPSDGDPLVNVFGLDTAAYYLWLSPLLGGVFAVVLWLMFVAGILKGTVFPELINTDNTNGLPFFHFSWRTIPKSAEGYGKLLIWSFLAGFAERLVPDSLDRLSAKISGSQNDRSNSAPITGGPPNGNVVPPPPGNAPNDKPHISDQVVHAALHTGEVPPKVD